MDFGIGGVELDIHRCASGELVVIHDFTLKRIAGAEDRIEELGYDEISRVDAGSHFSHEFAGTRIPLLHDVFAAFGTSIYYDIEIKSAGNHDPQLVSSLLSLISSHGLADSCIISSFNPLILRDVARATDIPVAMIFKADKKEPFLLRHGEGALIAGARVLKPHWSSVRRGMMTLYRRLGNFAVIPWTVDDVQTARSLLELGVEGLISNRPEELPAAGSGLRK